MKFSLRPRRERFLVVEVNPESTHAFLLGIDDEKRITCERVWRNTSLAEVARIKSFFRKPAMIIGFDPALASVEFQPFKNAVGQGHLPLEPHEFENILAESLEHALPLKRTSASKALGIDELDVVLVQGRALSLTLDKRETHYPPGQSGKTLEGILELIFVPRMIFDQLAPFFEKGQQPFLTEIGKSELSCLARVASAPLGVMLFSDTGGRGVACTSARGSGAVFARTDINFHPSRAVADLAATWGGMPSSAADQVYDAYLAHATSARVSRDLAKLFVRHRRMLQSICVANHLRGKLYIHTSRRLPFVLPIRSRGAICDELPVLDLMKRLGFHVPWDDLAISPTHFFRALAPLIEYQYNKSDSRVAHSLMRRIHWINPLT